MRLRPAVFALTACLTLSFGVAAAKTTVNIGIVTNPTFVHVQAANWFKEDVEKAMPGKYDIVVHHSGALGSETQVLQQVQLGRAQHPAHRPVGR